MEKEKIRINQKKKTYEIEDIRLQSEHVLQIVFVDAVPEKFGDIMVYTAGGILCSNLPGFSTIYHRTGNTVYLSDDGSQFAEKPFEEEQPSFLLPAT